MEEEDSNESTPMQNQQQPLTIFYDGKMCVTDVTEIQVNISLYIILCYHLIWLASVWRWYDSPCDKICMRQYHFHLLSFICVWFDFHDEILYILFYYVSDLIHIYHKMRSKLNRILEYSLLETLMLRVLRKGYHIHSWIKGKSNLIPA